MSYWLPQLAQLASLQDLCSSKPGKLRRKPGDYQAKYRFLFELRASTLLAYTSGPERPKGVTIGE